jgi:acyl-CoA reductase-like NAD-dependent aldehyde dehydrogenase
LLNNRETGNIAFGGQTDRYQRYFAPTLVTGVSFNDKVLMSEEIFGPILPVVTYTDMEAAMGLINKK